MKKQKTLAEIQAHEQAKKERREYRKEITKHKNIIKEICIKKDLRTAEIQLAYMKENPERVRRGNLSIDAAIQAYKLGIEEYKQSL